MKTTAVLVCFVASMALGGCKGGRHDNAADEQALRDNETQWNADFASKDVSKIAGHYADDAILLVAGEKPTVGKDAITAEFKAMASDPIFSLQLHTDRAVVAASGDLGFTQGTYTLTITNPADRSVVHDSGSYLTNYRKGADGTWKAIADAPVSSVPPAAPTSK